MRLLAIETATEACSAALALDSEILDRFEMAPRRHAELILPMVDSLLAEAGLALVDLDALAFGRGPGAFTGLRVAAGVAQGLAFGADLPIIPVSSLAVLAQGAAADHPRVAAAIDARMGEIYWCAFRTAQDGLVEPLGEERVLEPDSLRAPEGTGWFGIGTGWKTYEMQLKARFGDRLAGSDGERYPLARNLLALARREFQANRTVSADQAQPVYLRNKVTR